MSGDRSGPADAPQAVDAAEQLRLVAEQRSRTRQALAPDERVVFGAWGLAWFVGLGLMWLSSPMRDGGPLVAVPGLVVGLLFVALLVGAGVVTTVHSVRAGRGLAGPSSRTGAMYGWGWFLGFAMLPCIVLSADRLGASPETVALLWPAVSGLVVGLMYIGGAAAWDSPLQFAIGAWIIVTTGAGCLLGVPTLYLVMALAGGGGFLATAAWFTVRRARSSARVGA